MMDDVTSVEGSSRAVFEWGRVQSPLDVLLPGLVAALVLAFVVHMYRRDSVELRWPVRWLLTGLRMAAFVLLLAIYFQPQLRNEHDQVENSRVVLLVDTSMSMDQRDVDGTVLASEPSRAERLIGALGGVKWVDQLRRKHDVVLAGFDQDSRQLSAWTKLPVSQAEKPDDHPPENPNLPDGSDAPFDWNEALAPRGIETRLGQALRQWLEAERTQPLSAVVVFTDGQHNSGIDPSAGIAVAREMRVPVHTVGLGSLIQPVNVRVSDLVAPVRAFPGDPYTVTGDLQAQGLAGKSVAVRLFSRDAAGQTTGEGKLEASQTITLGGDGEVVPVRFELTLAEAGRRTLQLRVEAPAEDTDPADNTREADVEIVDRQTRVLLFAGGAGREYQFLRNQLRRDRDVIVDVLLQTAGEGVSQDAHEILAAFPTTAAELAEYDAIVAFDPDWRELTVDQQNLLHRWVDEQAGGLIVIAGPVFTEKWSQDPALAKIRDLYPVEFNRRLSLLDNSRHQGREPSPLEFTREGQEADFLWIDESASASARAWADFPGVFGYFSVRGPKQGRPIYARLPSAEGGQKPIYMAGQFVGAGQVFYLGSGEMWRLRSQGDAYFERFYTKLIRHVSQGRLLRGSPHGSLLVDRDRCLRGATVDVRARLLNSRLEPLDAPRVPLELSVPDGSHQTLELLADATQAKGSFRGQFTARREGVYVLELPVPDADNERLVRRVQVKVPELESENPRRNDALLSEIARKTGGTYYIGLEAAISGVKGPPEVKPLADLLRDQSRVKTEISAPTPLWSNASVMGLLCGLLCLEWLVRRLAKLA
jgi:hypothetical protein